MNQFKRFGLIAAACLCISTSTVTVFEHTEIVAEAHSGRTDGSGGHRDNKNKSGLGSYHYHCGGYPAHLHEHGVCPYDGSGSSASGASSSGTASSQGTEAAVTQELMDSYVLVFDATYYYDNNTDLQTAVGSDSLKLFEHFLNNGMAEGRIGCEGFNVNVYRENNSDLQDAFGDDLTQYYTHYINSGCHESRVCH